ncbi:FAD:protein FMN transferase [Dactylosporangium sp. CS-033363]|uniref:FAD:protein FMN transferase n=1 Tax=Dactylosporangium sp. CS-033363 TaxID=3239935 RepID=UPI003D8EFAEE
MTAAVSWPALGVEARLVVTDRAGLAAAEHLVRHELTQVDEACGAALTRDDGRPVDLDPLPAALVAAALETARATGGAITPVLAARSGPGDLPAVEAPWPPGPLILAPLPYESAQPPREATASARPAVDRAGVRMIVYPTADWRHIRLAGRRLTLPPGMRLDLGPTARAWAADRCARLVEERCGGGIGALVTIGGDIATAGPAPGDGWDVLVQDRPDEPRSAIRLPAGGALATTRPAGPVWRTVTVAARSCRHARTLSASAAGRGRAAYDWLARQGAPARLVAQDLGVHATPGWPA